MQSKIMSKINGHGWLTYCMQFRNKQISDGLGKLLDLIKLITHSKVMCIVDKFEKQFTLECFLIASLAHDKSLYLAAI